MFRIGEFSKMSKTTIKTLRYYDRIGLLKPECIDEENRYRFYTTTQLFSLHYIQSLRQVGLSLDEIHCILDGHDASIVLVQRKEELRSEREIIHEQLSRIEFILSRKQEDFSMSYQAIIKEVPECIVYSKKMTVPNYESYFQLVPAIGEEVMKANPTMKCAIPEYCFIIYHDGEYKEKDIHVEYCEAVEEMGQDVGDIVFKKMESESVLSIMHKGDYTGLSEAYAYAFKWIEENGYRASQSPRESYIDGIWNKDSKEDWLTELQVPIQKK